jgi:hypothetical protein
MVGLRDIGLELGTHVCFVLPEGLGRSGAFLSVFGAAVGLIFRIVGVSGPRRSLCTLCNLRLNMQNPLCLAPSVVTVYAS